MSYEIISEPRPYLHFAAIWPASGSGMPWNCVRMVLKYVRTTTGEASSAGSGSYIDTILRFAMFEFL